MALVAVSLCLAACDGREPDAGDPPAVVLTAGMPEPLPPPRYTPGPIPTGARRPATYEPPPAPVWTFEGRAIGGTFPSFATLRAGYPQLPPWPGGPGAYCDGGPCPRGEVCCQDGAGRHCIPDREEKACLERGGTVSHCDETSDCAKGELCCAGRVEPSDAVLAACVTPARCDRPWDRPGGYGIPAAEVCRRGGTCGRPDDVCIDDTTSVVFNLSGGRCVSSRARVACGEGRDCPADRPWCYWNEQLRRGECIPRGAWMYEDGVLACDGTADCNDGAVCCGGGSMTTSYCGHGCDPELAYAPRLCRALADCAGYADRPVSCDREEDLPDGLGTCGWGAPTTAR